MKLLSRVCKRSINKTSSSNKTLEVLVLYTDDAYEAVTNIFSIAFTAVYQTETAYRNSAITSSELDIRRVATRKLDNFQESTNIGSDVSKLASDSEANSLRDFYGADAVVLLTNGNYGIYLGIVKDIGPSNSNAYAIVQATAAAQNYVFAHEVGHLQGARHGDTHRWFDGGTERRTIMYYESSNAVIQHFSNPNVYYNGIATGTTNNNVAQKLRNTASTMANFRQPLPLSVSISGPGWLSEGQQGTWTPSVSGGRSPYSYRWDYKRLCGDFLLLTRAFPCNTWHYGGSGYSFSGNSAINPHSRRLKLTVTDVYRTSKVAYKNVWVAEHGSGGLSASYKQTAGEALQNSSLTALPETYALASNYPNPFNPSTEIRFTLPEASAVSLVVYDVMGREVERLLDKTLGAGYHEARWDATGLPSGVYLYRIEAGSFAQTRHMTLLK